MWSVLKADRLLATEKLKDFVRECRRAVDIGQMAGACNLRARRLADAVDFISECLAGLDPDAAYHKRPYRLWFHGREAERGGTTEGNADEVVGFESKRF